jgi:hypothetical protein
MTTFWLSFADVDDGVLGVAIFDLDESTGKLSAEQIVGHAWNLGINPGGGVLTKDMSKSDPIPDKYKNQLITDDDLLEELGAKPVKDISLPCSCSKCGDPMS